ncbi:MAG: ECF transporter S component [Oscillospiraceae bacterium]|nr:ECF transporter S component [Oscillospiraceae bacterium]
MIILELMVPFFMAFEGRKPQARELVVVAVLSAIAIAGRVAIPIPHFKAAFAIIMLAGIAFGPETGFIVGAITAFASNFFYGQGAFTPWQMMGYGAGGMLAGFLFRRGWLPRNRWVMAAFGFAAVIVWVGPLLDCSHIFLTLGSTDWVGALGYLISGFWVNLVQGVCTMLVMLLFGIPLLEKLDRIKMKYGMMEDENGL